MTKSFEIYDIVDKKLFYFLTTSNEQIIKDITHLTIEEIEWVIDECGECVTRNHLIRIAWDA